MWLRYYYLLFLPTFGCCWFWLLGGAGQNEPLRSSSRPFYGVSAPFRAVDLLNNKKKKRGGGLDYQDERRFSNNSTTAALNKGNVRKEEDQSDHVQELYFTQKLDHFSITNNNDRTFQQRYFVSERYVRRRRRRRRREKNQQADRHQTIAFVCVGGEGPALEASVLIDSVHCTGDMLETARKLYEMYDNDDTGFGSGGGVSIYLYALEHRYYGYSYPAFDSPLSPVSNENLIYLSSRQAAADLAHFIQTKIVPTATTSVILFGGSYPGMLAAFTRLKYPHLVTAAVSNSAPVQAVLDFAAYNNHVASDLANPAVGGSDECLRILKDGHAALAQLVLNPVNHDRLADQFHLCNAESLRDRFNIQMWIGDGVFGLGTQGNDPACDDTPLCNLEKKCEAMVDRYHQEVNQNSTTPTVNVLAWMATELRSQNQPNDDDDDDDDCVELDWNATLDFITNPKTGQEGGLRSWLWQTCTEFGFYQSCERGSACPYAQGWHPLSQDLQLCEVAFAVPAKSVASAVQATNEWTGGWHLSASHVLSMTGTADPWSELAIENTNRANVYSVAGASHHFWTHPVKSTDDAAVSAARNTIFSTVHGWLFTLEDSSAENGTMHWLRVGSTDS